MLFRSCADATITKPVLDSQKGVVLSYGINPTYSDIDTYDMAANAIDTAVRNAVCAGGDLKQLALLDNFCWCSSNEPERLGQLKRAAQACYDYATAYGTPFISGKDSMFNDFNGFDENGYPTKISVPPTLLISAIGIVEDCKKAVSIDAKMPGDPIYLLGETFDELGGSEYFAMMGESKADGRHSIGEKAPKVGAERNFETYKAIASCINSGMVASAVSVHRGGLGVALAKMAMGGKIGAKISIKNVSSATARDDYALFSESSGRIIVTVAPGDAEKFEKMVRNVPAERIGEITANGKFCVFGKEGNAIIDTSVDEMLKAYKSTFAGY